MWSTFSPLDHWGLLRFKVTLPEERLLEPGWVVPAAVPGSQGGCRDVACGKYATVTHLAHFSLSAQPGSHSAAHRQSPVTQHHLPPRPVKAHTPGRQLLWQVWLMLGNSVCRSLASPTQHLL